MRWILSLCLLALSLTTQSYADSVLVQIAGPEPGSTGTSTKVTQSELVALIGTGKPGTYTFLIITPTASGISLRECTFTVTDKAGTPTTTPAEPQPPAYVSKYGLEKLVREWMKDVPAEAAKDAKRLALAYATTIVQIEKDKIKTVEELQTHQRETNKLLLGDKAVSWTTWGMSLGTELQRLKNAGLLESLDDHKQAWMEIARGLNGEGVSN